MVSPSEAPHPGGRDLTNQNGHEVVLQDAIALLAAQTDDSVPLIIADPPYGIAYHSNHYKDKNPHAPVMNDWNFQIGRFLLECERVLVEGGALYLFSRWDVSPLWVPAIPSTLTLKTVIVWVKNNWSAGDLTGCFGNQYEQLLFIAKGRHLLRGKRWSNVWRFPRVSSTTMLHPTQKPVPLLERAIRSSSDEGDLVLDPFCGSGSTGEAAANAKRRFLLGDIDPHMVNISRARLGLSLLELDDRQEVEYTDYRPTVPDAASWGIHPEELRFVYDALAGNRERILGQLCLEPAS